jgi:hypothetical protein
MKAILVRRGDEEQAEYLANDARQAANLGVDLGQIQPDHTVSSLSDVLPLVD